MKKLLSFSTFSLLIPIVAFYTTNRNATMQRLFFLGAGQVFTSCHSIFESSFRLDRLFIGAVTESGQLAITVTVLLVAILSTTDQEMPIIFESRVDLFRSIPSRISSFIHRFYNKVFKFYFGLFFKIRGVVHSFICKSHQDISNQASNSSMSRKGMLLCFALLLLASYSRLIAVGFGLVMVYAAYFFLRSLFQGSFCLERKHYELCFLVTLTSLIVNLKRAPIIAAGITIVGVMVLYHTLTVRILLPVATGVLSLIAFLPALRNRFFSSIDHFLISGGRSDIWEVGLYLLKNASPLGYANSHRLQDFNHAIPDNLTHFHSNFLNILVEVGPIPLCFLGYIFYSLYKRSLHDRFYVGLNLAILSIVIGGIFEYNIGDTEILLIIFLLAGVIEGELDSRATTVTSVCDNVCYNSILNVDSNSSTESHKASASLSSSGVPNP